VRPGDPDAGSLDVPGSARQVSMARFDQHDTAARNLPVPLDVATNELESFVERHVREIIEAARERAGKIEREAADRAGGLEREAADRAGRVERDAAEWADRVKREAEQRAQELFDESFKRAWRILDGIDLLESGVGDLIGALRAEMEGFAADLGSASPAEGQAKRPLEQSSSTTRSVDAFEQRDGNHAEVEQMIIEQVATMFHEGRSRADAERLVMRFKKGEHYLHVLDQFYSPDAAGSVPPPLPEDSDRGRWGFRPGQS
jgi:hypothetical protein